MGRTKEKFHAVIAKVIFLIIVLGLWEAVAKAELFGPSSKLVFPTLEDIAAAFVHNFTEGFAGTSFGIYILNSIKILMLGLLIGIVLAAVFSGLAIICKMFFYIYDSLVSICDLLPGVALLPVVIVIFGINPAVIVFLVVHAVIWPMSRNILDGFSAVPKMYIEAGENIGLKGISLIFGIYIPASASYIISGLKVGWARAWRGLLSAEMIFGIASCPGIGLYINQMRTSMKNAEMYATLIVIVIIGVIVQYGILAPVEKYTVKRWGMSR